MCEAVSPLVVVPSPKLMVLRTTGLPLLSWLAVPFAVTLSGKVPELGERLSTAVGGASTDPEPVNRIGITLIATLLPETPWEPPNRSCHPVNCEGTLNCEDPAVFHTAIPVHPALPLITQVQTEPFWVHG